MLSKKQRLPIQQFVDKKAEVRRSPYFTVKTFATTLPYSRFGVVISKKVSPKATERNRLKRLIFAQCAKIDGSPAGGRQARDVLIIVQKGAIIEELPKIL